jgi:uncharacterized protein (DUF1501 family)
MIPRLDRRQFGVAALSATLPVFLHKTGRALAADAGRHDGRVLVIVQLAGGNDGLNTLVPHADDAYYKARPRIGIDRKKILRLDDRLGLPSEMADLHRLFQDGGLAVIPNVGYPNPSRSHFRSMDIWETASPAKAFWKTGWVGRYFDATCSNVQGGMLGVRLGEQPALTFTGKNNRAATFVNPASLDVPADGAFAKGLDGVTKIEPTGIDALDFIQRTANETRDLSRRIREAVRDVKPAVDYPPFILCQSLKLVAQMIIAEAPTRVYYVTLGGFDTHSGQMNRHLALLQELSQALALFRKDLAAHKQLERVALVTFSEFGRRVEENQQAGTDHGTANVVFALGGKVKAGIHGQPPNLEKLDERGDLVHETDFRSVYAAVLRDWLSADADTILEGKFTPVPLFTRG